MNGIEMFRQTSAKQTNAQTHVRQPNKQMVENGARRSHRRSRPLANGGGGGARDQDRLYFASVFVLYLYHWVLFPGGSRWECDDYLVGMSSSSDFWKVFVR